MELYRRAASGRLSELLGEATIAVDKRFLRLGLRRAAEIEWQRVTPTCAARVRKLCCRRQRGDQCRPRPASTRAPVARSAAGAMDADRFAGDRQAVRLAAGREPHGPSCCGTSCRSALGPRARRAVPGAAGVGADDTGCGWCAGAMGAADWREARSRRARAARLAMRPESCVGRRALISRRASRPTDIADGRWTDIHPASNGCLLTAGR